ncbi:MAG: PEP-CTERM sorting domain-containing protein [Planctomycetota bacterium]|jgi:hypothetical protein
MGMIRNITCLAFLLVLVILPKNASAALLALPDSSYLGGLWQGTSYYNDDGFNLRIDFAVYDTLGGNEIAAIGGFEAPGDGQYIYAYQVFQHIDEGYNEVTYFTILNLDSSTVDESLIQSTTALDDNDDGIAPNPLISENQGVWLWGGDTGYISTAQHSWFLVFSSDSAPIAGSYEVQPSGDIAVPIPEPMTVALLGFGALTMLRKRKYA